MVAPNNSALPQNSVEKSTPLSAKHVISVPGTMNAKAQGALKIIGEVAQILGVPQHVLRFWETKFSQIRPLKRGGQRRYYRPEDVALLARIQSLLHNQGYTIKGVQKILREGGKSALLLSAPDLPDASLDKEPANTSVTSSMRTPAPSQSAMQEAITGLTLAQRAALSAVLTQLRTLRALIAA